MGGAVQKTVRQLERLLKLPGCNKVPMLISNRDDAVTAAQHFAQSSRYTLRVTMCVNDVDIYEPVCIVWLFFALRHSSGSFSLLSHHTDTQLCVQRHSDLHTVKCFWGESGPAEGFLQHPAPPQQQQRAGGAHATAHRVPGTHARTHTHTVRHVITDRNQNTSERQGL